MNYLGQHFLKNKSAIGKIIAALDIRPGEIIIEIGPGKGALTFPLAQECAKKNSWLIAIEKDDLLAQELKSKINLPLHPGVVEDNVKIITGDALEELLKIIQELKIKNLKFKIVGNIPYYITGKLLRIISELKNKPSLTVLMLQKEVAERICAKTRIHADLTRTDAEEKTGMNLLAAAVQFWADPKIILKLKPQDFIPPPKVDSIVIKLKTRDISVIASEAKQSVRREIATSRTSRNDKTKKENAAKEAEKYYKLIHIIFKQPRKTLINNLEKGLNLPKKKLEKSLKFLNLPINCRPQDLSIENIKAIQDLIFNI